LTESVPVEGIVILPESHRVFWRLIPLRGLSHVKKNPLLPGAA
jgi:hypothetical protein